MTRSDESVVYWKENVTLRRFLIVSGLLVLWIGCDLAIHTLAQPGIGQSEIWVQLESATGLPFQRLFVEARPHDPRLKTNGHDPRNEQWVHGILLRWLPADSWRLHLYTAYSLPALGLLALVLLDRLVNQGKTSLPRGITLGGGLFIVGGAMLDMAVTVAHSPNLELEGNPYVRILLDSQHSLTFVYIHALFTQSLYITLFCGIWIGFLRHRQIIVQTISASSPRSWLEFLKAATGGSHLTVRQWLFPIRPSEAPLLYHYVWLVAIPVVFGISLFRWYAAMEWLGLVEPTDGTRVCVILHGVFSTLVLYLLALWRLYQQSLERVAECGSPVSK